MKKALLGTSAIALATAFGSQAGAAEFDVKIGGFSSHHVAYSSVDVEDHSSDGDADYDGVDVKRDTEIIFQPSITLDNGIKIGANVQLEANSGDTIDEGYLSIDGSFGRILLGSENSARYLMHYAGPDVSYYLVNSGYGGDYIPFSAGNRAGGVHRGTMYSTYIENGRNNDAERITYFTPRMSGFQFGISYARDMNEDSNAQVNLDASGDGPTAHLGNIVDLGLNYVGNQGGVSIAAAVGYGIAFGDTMSDGNPRNGDESNNPQVWNAGLRLGWENWTIGGSFAEQNNSYQVGDDGIGYNAGIQYADGPWAFTFAYGHGEGTDNENRRACTNTSSGGVEITPGGADACNGWALGRAANETIDNFAVGVTYALAKGVTVGGFAGYLQFKESHGNIVSGGTGAVGMGDDLDAFVIGSGINIGF